MKLGLCTLKSFLGKMNFRNEHDNDLIIGGNVRTQLAFLMADFFFV